MKRSRAYAWLAISSILTAGLVCTSAGCGSQKPPKRPTQRVQRTPKPKAPVAQQPAIEPLLPAYVVAELTDENATPYFARRGQEGLLLYNADGQWKTRIVGADGAPKSAAPVDVAPTGTGMPLASLRASHDGYLAAWVEPVANNDAIKILALDAAGKSVGAPALVLQSAEEIAWVEVLPNAKGALLLWETQQDEKTDLTIANIVGGKTAGPPKVIARDVLQWQAVATERGAAIAYVQVSPQAAQAAQAGDDKGEGRRGSKMGRVLFVEIDANGAPSSPSVVNAEPSAHADVEIVEVGGRYVIAWTDERAIDASVMLAVVSPGGALTSPPHKATAPLGEQALIGLEATPYRPGAQEKGDRALLAWEDLLAVPREGRVIRLATVGADGAVGGDRASLVLTASSGAPDLAVTKGGFAAVTLAPASLSSAKGSGGDASGASGDASANEARVWPTYVRFGPDLSVLAAEPIRSEPFARDAAPYVPYLVRGLSCEGATCTTLAAGAGARMPLAIVPLPVRESAWKSPARREPEEQPPRATSATALLSGAHMSEVTSADMPAGGSLVAWVTYHLESPAGDAKAKGDDALATLGLTPLSAAGAAGKTVTISKRAVSIGGVAVAPAPAAAAGKPGEAAVAWVAREKAGEAQVFVTKVGDDGAKIAQKKLTLVPRKKRDGVPSECSDVAIAYAPGGGADDAKAAKTADASDGWIVAWVDTRDGNSEVYVAKVDRSLKKVVPDRRITTAPGDAADVQIVVRGKETWLVWSDARQSADEGTGDIYLARLDTRTLQKLGEETRLFASAGHSRSPVVAPSPQGLLVAWIEEALGAAAPASAGGKQTGDSADASGVRIAEIDAKGTVIGAPALVRGEEGAAVSSAALICGRKVCRGVLASAVGEAQLLGAFQVSPGSPPGPLKTLAALGGGTTQDVSPSFSSAGASLFLADNAVDGSSRVRWMTIVWP
jgi:hypothetical protein